MLPLLLLFLRPFLLLVLPPRVRGILPFLRGVEAAPLVHEEVGEVRQRHPVLANAMVVVVDDLVHRQLEVVARGEQPFGAELLAAEAIELRVGVVQHLDARHAVYLVELEDDVCRELWDRVVLEPEVGQQCHDRVVVRAVESELPFLVLASDQRLEAVDDGSWQQPAGVPRHFALLLVAVPAIPEPANVLGYLGDDLLILEGEL